MPLDRGVKEQEEAETGVNAGIRVRVRVGVRVGVRIGVRGGSLLSAPRTSVCAQAAKSRNGRAGNGTRRGGGWGYTVRVEVYGGGWK